MTLHSVSKVINSSFYAFVKQGFRKTYDEKLGDQPYVAHLCFELNRFIDSDVKRLLINLPPQHLKSFVSTICLAAYLLGKNPRIRIMVVAYDDSLAEKLCSRIRDMMQSRWYREAFTTRIKDGHSRANDFETTRGGGVFAVAATGRITGRSADVIIYDDPHEIKDWDNDRELWKVRNNFSALYSRLQDKVRGRILVVAHRVSPNDLSADLLQQHGWRHICLPLVAVKTRNYDLGFEEWTRVKGDVLRPPAYPRAEVARIQRIQNAPPFELLYQQGLGSQPGRRVRPEHFMSFTPHELPNAPVVLSIDPGVSASANASYSVIQAWTYSNRRYYLIDQFRRQCDAEALYAAFWFFVRKYNPAIALIENTANGPALIARVRPKVRFEIKPIRPRQEEKRARLRDHLGKILGKRIYLPEFASWREAFVDEIVGSSDSSNDQLDATTQGLDFLGTNPVIPMPRVREIGVLGLGSSPSLGREVWSGPGIAVVPSPRFVHGGWATHTPAQQPYSSPAAGSPPVAFSATPWGVVRLRPR